ncbi:MAG: hypothetical protein RL398_2799 [Planctomycetota bacterium]|jgi:signal transduction histidine kinase/CheY-like chemotaxis protein
MGSIDESTRLAGSATDLQQTAALLLSTQQALIDLKHRRDLDRRVLEGIVRAGERIAIGGAGASFWDLVVDAAVDTFQCEAALVLDLEAEVADEATLASRGPRLAVANGDLVAKFRELVAAGTDWLDADKAATLQLGASPVAALIFAPLAAGREPTRRVLAVAVSQRKSAFFPAIDAIALPGLRLFAGHVSALHDMHASHRMLAEQAAELDRSNGHLKLRIEQQQRTEAEKIKLQAQLEQAKRMEAIGRLAGGVAHDFNNLLTVVVGNVELLELRAALDEDSAQLLAGVKGASRRAQELTRQLLTLSRKQVISPKQLDFGEVVGESFKLYRRLIDEDIDVEFAGCTQPCPVLADRQQLDQVFGNLLINARDAVRQQPPGRERRVVVSMGLCPIDAPLPSTGSAVRLTVTDSGVGIPESARAEIFEPFYTTKANRSGTGLGLATVMGIVQQNGAAIEVESSLGTGSSFHVYWPLRDAIAEPTKPVDGPPRSSGKACVLFVEDDDAVRLVMERGLRLLGYEVHPFARGDLALQAIDDGLLTPQILVTDVVMPHMNGKELSIELQRRKPDLPVLFISGYADDILADHGIVGADVSLMTKPITALELGQRIREMLPQAKA